MLTFLAYTAFPTALGLAALAITRAATTPTRNPQPNPAQVAGNACANCDKRWPAPTVRAGRWLYCPECAPPVKP